MDVTKTQICQVCGEFLIYCAKKQGKVAENLTIRNTRNQTSLHRCFL